MLEAVALEDADLGDRRFDKIFAFNVAPFWLQPEVAVGAVREHLARDGTVYILGRAPLRAEASICLSTFALDTSRCALVRNVWRDKKQGCG